MVAFGVTAVAPARPLRWGEAEATAGTAQLQISIGKTQLAHERRRPPCWFFKSEFLTIVSLYSDLPEMSDKSEHIVKGNPWPRWVRHVRDSIFHARVGLSEVLCGPSGV